MKGNDIVVVGSHVYGIYVDCDRLPKSGETVSGRNFRPAVLDDGGKGSNQALCAARLGARTKFIGAIGADRPGTDSLALLEQAGVDISSVVVDQDASTGVSVVIIDNAGHSIIVTVPGANDSLDIPSLSAFREIIARSKVCMTQFELSVEAALEVCQMAASVDTRCILTPSPLPTNAQNFDLSAVDVLILNEHEAAELLEARGSGVDAQSALDAAQQLISIYGVKHVVMTLGASGAVAIWGGDAVTVPAFKVEAANTVGAGDAFAAALAYGISRDSPISDALTFASAVAAVRVASPAPPWTAYPAADTVAQFLMANGLGTIADRLCAGTSA